MNRGGKCLVSIATAGALAGILMYSIQPTSSRKKLNKDVKKVGKDIKNQLTAPVT